MDARKRLAMARDKADALKMRAEIISAKAEIQNLEDRTLQNSSALVKYRQNFTIPAVWVPQQGIRISNIPQIPAEKIMNLNTYIQANTTNIDGGDLDAI
jgi:hypothetical protein